VPVCSWGLSRCSSLASRALELISRELAGKLCLGAYLAVARRQPVPWSLSRCSPLASGSSGARLTTEAGPQPIHVRASGAWPAISRIRVASVAPVPLPQRGGTHRAAAQQARRHRYVSRAIGPILAVSASPVLAPLFDRRCRYAPVSALQRRSFASNS
jgi:hypothetical protein